MTGNGVAQAINVAGALLLARLFAPEAFGLFALFVTVVSIVAVLGGARYELAIMLPDSDEEAANILALTALVVTGIAAAAALLIAGYGFTISYLVGDIRLSPWMWAVPIALFVNGIYQMLALWCARMKRFGRLAATRVTQASCIIVSQLAFLPFLPHGGSALVAGWIVGEYTAAIILLAQVLRDDGRFFAGAVRWRSVRGAVGKYKNFPLYKAPYSFLANASNQFVIIILRVLSDLHTVGLFSMAHRAVRAPITLITSSMNQVFYEKAATELKSGRLEQFVTPVLRLQAALAAPVLIFLAFEARLIFELLLGARWAGAGAYAALLAFAGFLYFLTAWMDRLIDVCARQRLSLMLKMASNATALGSLTFTLWYTGNSLLAVSVYVASEMFYTTTWLIIVYRVAGFPAARLTWVLRDALVSAGVALLAIGAIQAFFSKWVAFALSAVAAGLLVLAWMVLLAPLWSRPTSTAVRLRRSTVVQRMRRLWVDQFSSQAHGWGNGSAARDTKSHPSPSGASTEPADAVHCATTNRTEPGYPSEEPKVYR